MRFFRSWDEKGVIQKTRSFNDIKEGHTYVLVRSYHEISADGQLDFETIGLMRKYAEANGIDFDIINYVATPQGQTKFIKGKDEPNFRKFKKNGGDDLFEKITFHAAFEEEYDLRALMKKTGVPLEEYKDPHGKSFQKIAEKVKQT